jgi:hypothetical protein
VFEGKAAAWAELHLLAATVRAGRSVLIRVARA